ncbi:MAG TPA: hemerythrin family protein [Clostridiales bacterium]|nr:hemerythrin family protein [Clostridiales bacterium]
MYFEWKDNYEMGVKEVDDQHRKLFQIGRKLSDIIQSENVLHNYDEIERILIELKNYTIEHFSKEEQFMKEHGYTDLVSHAMEHAFLRKKLMKIDSLKEPNHKTLVELVSFVSDWISQHILITDMKIRNFLILVEKYPGA